MNIYTLTSKQAQLAAQLEDSGFDEQTIYDTLEAESGDVENAYEFLIGVCAGKQARCDGLATEIKRLQELQSKESADIVRIKQSMHDGIVRMGVTKFKTPLHDFSIAKTPPSVQIIEGATIPDKYYEHKPAPAPTVSKSLIKEAIKAGEDVSAFAVLTQGTRLAIK